MIGKFFYTISIHVYAGLIRTVAPVNKKAKLWLDGRKGVFEQMKVAFATNTAKVLWFHCSSLGEFELSRPLIEKFKTAQPEFKILLTFFSPSGYQVRKDYEFADWVFYLPIDTAENASKFISITKPSMAFFAKYEFWYYYTKALKDQDIPVISFSSAFREKQLFFKPYGGFYTNILHLFTYFFVQDKTSATLLKGIGINNIQVVGDTRFDRVKEICDHKKDIPLAAAFKDGKCVFIVGSAWQEDLNVLVPFFNNTSDNLKIIIAPHEIHDEEIEALRKRLDKKSVRYSQATTDNIVDANVLIIDNVGMLSSLYQYAEYAHIGGAYKQGLHNILEAATFGMPIFFGPQIKRFPEAQELVRRGGAFTIEDTEALTNRFSVLQKSEAQRLACVRACKEYVAENIGATDKIIAYCNNILCKD